MRDTQNRRNDRAIKRSASRKHDWVDERSRSLHVAIAEKIRRHPNLLEVASKTLARWEHSGSDELKPSLREWKIMIETWPLTALLEFLVEESERANRLRQSSPFSGVLTQNERNEIFARYETL